MTFTSILIPLVAGLLLVAVPQIFTKSNGDAFERAKTKLRRIGFVLLGVAVVYSIVKVGESVGQPGAETAKPQMEMHRVRAQTPGDSGWYLGESSRGSFSIQLPIPFNDFTLSGDDRKVGVLKTYCVGAQSAEGMKFSAVEAAVVRGAASPDLDQLPLELAKGGQKVMGADRTPVSGWPSVSFSIVSSESGAYVRYIRARTSLFILTLEYPAARAAEAASLKFRFL